MKPTASEILQELERLCRLDLLSPQERALLKQIVTQTLDGKTGMLYQKALADELGISSAKQIGVVGTRLRKKLVKHYRTAAAEPSVVRIELSDRGYEARFAYRTSVAGLDGHAQLLVANAKSAIDQRSLPGAAAALKYLDEALAADPRHPQILALRAYCHATRALFGTYPREDLQAADRIVHETRTTEPRPWESWFAEACVDMALRWDWQAAAASFERAIALSGGEAQFQPWYTAFLATQGRAAAAVALLQLALSRAHDSPVLRADLAASQIYAGRLGDAEETIRSAMALFGPRTHYLLYVHLAILKEAQNDAAAALDVLQQVPLKWPRTAVTLGLRAMFSGLAGDRRTARRLFRQLRTARAIARRFVPAGQLCIAAYGAGDFDTAVAWLREGAVVERDPNLVLSNVYPFFRHLYAYPDFRAVIVDTMKLSLPV